MLLQSKIDELILDIQRLLPSYGHSPFTIISYVKDQIDSVDAKSPVSVVHLLFLVRLNFNKNDLEDYLLHTPSYLMVPDHLKPTYLIRFMEKLKDQRQFVQWQEQIASMGLGMALLLAANQNLALRPCSIEPQVIDLELHLSSKNLRCLYAYVVYNKF